ncbi:hypothetical protein Syun_001985 [Stephania yunnanensis]|uniref:MORN repeat-containing protein n=1 Tax=Stephania yunnanensis TaxID=152371 RepID=A0AAP0LHU9_9MAGN
MASVSRLVSKDCSLDRNQPDLRFRANLGAGGRLCTSNVWRNGGKITTLNLTASHHRQCSFTLCRRVARTVNVELFLCAVSNMFLVMKIQPVAAGELLPERPSDPDCPGAEVDNSLLHERPYEPPCSVSNYLLGFTSRAPCKVQPYGYGVGVGVGFLSFIAFHISWLPKLCSVQGSAISSNLKALNWILQPLCMSAPVGLTDTVEPTFSCPGRTTSLDIFAYTEKELTNGQASLSSSYIVGFRVGEHLLPNGDLYSGSLLGNMPESSGKYIWSDGSVYEGEWRRGMRHGHGKTQWPSGAVYDLMLGLQLGIRNGISSVSNPSPIRNGITFLFLIESASTILEAEFIPSPFRFRFQLETEFRQIRDGNFRF